MQKSFNIWIPSIQYFIRFFELTVSQYKTILKSLSDNDVDFIFTLNDIIRQNIVDYADYEKLTTLDRFIIFLALKIHSCSPEIVLSSKCEKCETVSSIKMNLNTLIDNLATRIDKSFLKTVAYNKYIVSCDIPTIETDYKINEYGLLHSINKNTIDSNINNYVLTHIKEIFIDNKKIDIAKLSYENKLTVINKLPAQLIKRIQDEFLHDIHVIVSDFDFLKIKCTGKKCENEIEIKFDITNINDIIKIIYKDEILESILIETLNVTSKGYMNSETINSNSPMELHMMADMLKKAEAQAEPVEKEPKEKDMFEEYRLQTAKMKESPSEFDNL